MENRERLLADGYKTYENDALIVYWKPSLCRHAGECVRGDDEVFAPMRRPWIVLDPAKTGKIAEIVGKCPSGALLCEKKLLIAFEPARNQATAYDGGEAIGECSYTERSGKWIIDHTGVRDEYAGHGIARRLVEEVIRQAGEAGMEIGATCSYAGKVLNGS